MLLPVTIRDKPQQTRTKNEMKTTNYKIHELGKGLAQSIMPRVSFQKFGLTAACIALALLGLVPAHANDFKPGPLLNLGDSDVLHVCPEYFQGSSIIEVESSIVVNPTNPKNIVLAWMQGPWRAIGTAVSFDGGRHWERKLIPGLSLCTGGSFVNPGDPWLSFGPDGGLYLTCVAGNEAERLAILTSKSLDGGSHWSPPFILRDTTDKRFYPDYPRITADPTDGRLVYVICCNDDSGNRGAAILTRSMDGGATWETPRVIYDLGTANNGSEYKYSVDGLPGYGRQRFPGALGTAARHGPKQYFLPPRRAVRAEARIQTSTTSYNKQTDQKRKESNER